MACSKVSTTTTLPNNLFLTGSNKVSQSTQLEAKSINPGEEEAIVTTCSFGSFDLQTLNGMKVALPERFLFKNEIALRASASSFVTI